MNLFLTKLTTYMLGFGKSAQLAKELDPKWQWVNNITSAVDSVLWPLLIVVGAAGTIYAVVLGVNMARADSTEKREEAKKRLINVIIGIAITIALILFFKLLTSTIIPSLLPDVGFDFVWIKSVVIIQNFIVYNKKNNENYVQLQFYLL